jgi:farnesyl-diphosphate farnesyltransferase
VELAKSKTKGKALVAVKGRVQHQAVLNEEIWSTTGRVFAISAVISILVVGAAWLMETHFNLA